jgi:DNA-binding NarL/FixJ family response regulator
MRILIVDDVRIVLDGLRAVLEGAGFSVVGSAATGGEALLRARELHPDLVIIEIAMTDPSGIQATRLLCLEQPELKVLALSTKSDRQSVLETFTAGAHGYLAKSSASAEELAHAIRAVASGHKYVSPAVAAVLVTNAVHQVDTQRGRGASRPISAREREVLTLLAEGKSSKEIACTLKLGLPTIETHRRQIAVKLGIRSIAELTKYAVREGLTPLDAE